MQQNQPFRGYIINKHQNYLQRLGDVYGTFSLLVQPQIIRNGFINVFRK